MGDRIFVGDDGDDRGRRGCRKPRIVHRQRFRAHGHEDEPRVDGWHRVGRRVLLLFGRLGLAKLLAGAVWPAPAARPVRRYRRGRQHWSTPQEVLDEIAYLGAERQDKYQRYGWNLTAERVVGTGVNPGTGQ